MRIQVLSDHIGGLTEMAEMLPSSCELRMALIGAADTFRESGDAVIARVDLRSNENIVALKEMSKSFARIPKRIFVLDRPSRLSVMQSYALGATVVLSAPVEKSTVLATLFNLSPPMICAPVDATEVTIVAKTAAEYIRSVFGAVIHGDQIDVRGATSAGNAIIERVAEDGLSQWLGAVRDHHEGTYQHCLLVTGVAADFGLRLGLKRLDLERLVLAAVLHDVGKATVPVAILDKPGRLDDNERKVVESHPVTGSDVLKGNPDISADILDAVRHHHEALDGSGYPDKLSGARISDLTRILTISDIFSALIERRSYKSPMPRQEAFVMLRSMTGKLEMPLVEAFRQVALGS